MGTTRALFASIGVSVSLVAAAALSLFTVSVVIAFGGWSAGLGESAPATALVFGPSAGARTTDVKASKGMPAVVLPAAQRSASRPATASPPAQAAATPGASAQARVISHSVITAAPTPMVSDNPPMAVPTAAPKPATGDGVRRVGTDLSSTAHTTGKALADVIAPLGPPISAAVQKVLDVVGALLRRATDSLAGSLDKLGQK
jgi:hypothetical protein